jgi:hypothetical protein
MLGNHYFAVGIQEEILTRLTSIADLKVNSRTSTQQYQSKPGNLAKRLEPPPVVSSKPKGTRNEHRSMRALEAAGVIIYLRHRREVFK